MITSIKRICIVGIITAFVVFNYMFIWQLSKRWVVAHNTGNNDKTNRRVAHNTDNTNKTNTPVAHQSVRDILSLGLAKIDEDVLGMDIGNIIGTIANVSLMENRLMAKLQGLYRQRPERCVIRVAIHCAQKERCYKMINRYPALEDFARLDIFSWKIISCLPSVLPCDIERRFMVDTMTPEIMRQSDIVILGMVGLRAIDKLMGLRPPGQLWVYMTCESPLKRQAGFVPKSPGAGNPYNLTMYYTHDADLYAPYGHFQRTPVSTSPPLQNKTKLMAWMASHCSGMPWRRTEFVMYLKQHLDIDAYGECGGMNIVKDTHGANAVLGQYKFYLALENNECLEYITEKVSRNGFQSGAVPIVYGARRQDYARIFPANSYIDLQDFDSIGQFVDFIQMLDTDVQRYNKYFDWKQEGTVRRYNIWDFIRSPPEVSTCYLLRKLVHVSVYPETSWQKRVPDFGEWIQSQRSSLGPKRLLGFDIHYP